MQTSLAKHCILASLLVCMVAKTCWSEVFLLENGGTLQGTFLNRDRKSREPYLISIKPGIKVQLDAQQIEKVQPRRPIEDEYERLVPLFDETVEAQWKLCEWCDKHSLSEQRRSHLKRIIEIDPNHADARYALGFKHIHGQWTTQEEFMRSRGFERYRGRWRLSQDIHLDEKRRAKDIAEKDWRRRLKRWRNNLDDRNFVETKQKLLAIRDPLAVPSLAEFLPQEPLREVKKIYLDMLGNIATNNAVKTLIDVTLNDPDEHIFDATLDHIARIKHPDIVAVYAKTLSNADNIRVNRAAVVLTELGATSAIEPLIEALITTHLFTVPENRVPASNSIQTTFTRTTDGTSLAVPAGGTSLTTGKHATTYRDEIRNPSVLNALTTLSGGITFGYDKKAWRYWYNSEKNHKTSAVKGRRSD